jgi:hypothetical protein
MVSGDGAKPWMIRLDVELRFIARSLEKDSFDLLCTALARFADMTEGHPRLVQRLLPAHLLTPRRSFEFP